MTDNHWISYTTEPKTNGWYPTFSSYDQGEFGYTDVYHGSFYKDGKWYYDPAGVLNPPVILWLNIKCDSIENARKIAIEKSQK